MRIKWLAGASLLVAAVTGCGPADEADVPTPFEHPTPTPYEPGGGEQVGPSLNAEQLGALAPEALTMALEFDSDAVMAAYQDLFALADATCPEVVNEGMATYWYGDCTTANGTVFDGVVRVRQLQDTPENGGIATGVVFSTEGQALRIVAADGRYFSASAYLDARVADYDGQLVYSTYFSGVVETDAATAAGNRWMSGGVRGAMGRYASDDGNGRFMSLSGSFSVPPDGALAGAGATAMALTELTVISYGCVGLQGAFGVRDAEGAWHEGLFAPGEDPTPEQVCDSCGDASFQQQALGEFCSEASPFETVINWEVTPW